jgi:hypothetical protein
MEELEQKNKYYTPKIEEFRVGFEYEFKYHKDNPDWFTVSSATWQDLDYTYDDYEHQYDGKFEETHRVKYLDKEDIEELGFEFGYEEGNGVLYGTYKNDPTIHISWDGDSVDPQMCFTLNWWIKGTVPNHAYRKDEMGYEHYHKSHFKGTIKNKSELKELLEKLGVL